LSCPGKAWILVLFDVCVTNDSADVLKLLSEKSSGIRPAHSDRIKLLGDKLGLDLRRVHRRSEQARKPGHRLLWRSGWREQPKANRRRVARITGLGDGGKVGQCIDTGL
jgi:hypothetical protein